MSAENRITGLIHLTPHDETIPEVVELRVPDTYTVVPTDDPNRFATLSSFADGDVSIGSIEMVDVGEMA